jgi:hypothetical protein
MFAGGLNLIDFWEKIWPNAIGFLSLGAFSWGYVFGLLMARREVVTLGLVASTAYLVAGLWLAMGDWRLGALLVAVGGYGLAALLRYRSYILAT